MSPSLLLFLLPHAQADDVLLLYDEPSSTNTSTAALVAALTSAGHSVTESDTNESSYDGTNPAPTGFDVVIHHVGTTYGADMPAAGQAALLAFVQAGGGYIGTPWRGFAEAGSGYYAGMTDLLLIEHTNGDRCGLTPTFTPVSSQSGHTLANGLTAGFTFTTCLDQGYARVFSTDPSTVIFQDDDGYDAVITRELGSGRIVNFSLAPNYNTGAAVLTDANVQQLYLNAIDWAGYCSNNPDVDGDGLDALFCGGTDCDDGDSGVGAGLDWHLDSDGDGYGDLGATLSACDQPSGYILDSDDCDDSDGAVNPAATETCDNIDNNCDGAIDEDSAADAATWYADSDNDGYGDASNDTRSCDRPSGYLADDSDCDDSDSAVNPAALETCDSVDNNCDGEVDEDSAVDAATWYADSDGDGYGDPAVTDLDCDQPRGYVADSSDCDDGSTSVYPNAIETCDGVDNNCDGEVDEDSAVDALTWYADSDSDGYGDATLTDLDCDQPSGFVSDSSDCDDATSSTYPGAPEVAYDGVDQDCDGADLCDSDLDGASATECGGDDCDDGDPDVNPDAPEVWYDGLDQDCDGASDYDADADGFESATYGGEDCDDADPDTYPGAPDEPYDGVINDCDDANEYDADGDGAVSVDYGGEDCDDSSSEISPDAEEVWYDGVDQDCDGNDDDQDLDGWALADDCDDTDPDSYPGADGLDEDCQPLSGDTGLGGGDKDCGCASGPAPESLGWLLLGALGLLLRRRR